MANIVLDAPAAASGASPPRNQATAPRADARLSARLALLSIVGFWLFYYLFNTLHMAVVNADGQLGMMVRRVPVSVGGALVTGLLWLVLRRFDGRPLCTLVGVAFLASLPVSFAYAAFNYTAFYVVHPGESELQELAHKPAALSPPMQIITEVALNWYFFIVAWAALYIALSYAERVRFAERDAASYRAQAQSAQLRALRYQINPHFLFNTLNALSTLVMRRRADEAERMIINLSNFFRTSLTADPAEDVALADEIRMQRLYLDIEQIRFPERLQVVIDVPSALETAAVPGLILQPIVENAIKYGVARSARPVTVSVRARAERDRLHLTVEDDGLSETGRDGHAGETQGSGVGLRNVCDRLAARFGNAASCRYGPRPDGGFRVDLVMPLEIRPTRGA